MRRESEVWCLMSHVSSLMSCILSLMKDMSEVRRGVSVKFALWSAVICLSVGLIMDVRPTIIIERTLISAAISAVLGYLLTIFIETQKSRREAQDTGQQEKDYNVES
jgi:membrane protein implicated in regulation of membrane protease activity